VREWNREGKGNNINSNPRIIKFNEIYEMYSVIEHTWKKFH